jgi:hypothetical protein
MRLARRRSRLLSLLVWAVLVAVLAAIAYLGGAILARRWMTPSLALPGQTPSPERQVPAAGSIGPDEPVEGTLGAETMDEWRFQGEAGESVTIEMWFHPGSGSSVEAELIVRLISPSGTVLVEKQGSVFLPPYLFEPSLPTTGDYRLQVLPLSGTPGRYSLNLALSTDASQPTAESTSPRPTIPAEDGYPATAAVEFQWPTKRRAISGWTFHDPKNPGHIGLDIDAEMWDPIVAALDGKVVFAEWGGGYGNLVILEHDNGWSSYYAHLTEIAVEAGQNVRQGETLGGAGTTGYSTGPHLHFELRYKGRPVDPHVHLP